MDEQPILVDRIGWVHRITLNRAPRRNAMTYADWEDLSRILAEVAAGDARVVVIGGADGQFCAGADLTLAEHDQHPHAQLSSVARACAALVALPQPTIAEVDGVAVGAGFGLAIACDFVVSSSRARFGTMFTARGLSPDFGSSWLLPRLVGLRMAKRLCLLPGVFDAAQADRLGLLDAVVDAGELRRHVDRLAAELAAGAPIALRLTKQLLNDSLGRGLAESLTAETAAQAINRLSSDSDEGIAAFLERRPPDFQGR